VISSLPELIHYFVSVQLNNCERGMKRLIDRSVSYILLRGLFFTLTTILLVKIADISFLKMDLTIIQVGKTGLFLFVIFTSTILLIKLTRWLHNRYK